MNKEGFYKYVIIVILLLIILAGFLLNLFLGLSALTLFFFICFLGVFFFFMQLYLRIQHNIDRIKSRSEQNINLENSKEFNKIKNSYEELTDFLEILIDYLEELKKKNSEEKILLEDIKNRFNENLEMQKKLASGVEDLFNSQYEQTIRLEKEWEKKFEDFVKKSRNFSKPRK
ncbi:MAG: hypothetical protein PHF67_03815 [Candidatus Nanoarchaeia archaeon]|nr:hypothetical protein [Candidatus Nanoarchaeia archaeon]